VWDMRTKHIFLMVGIGLFLVISFNFTGGSGGWPTFDIDGATYDNKNFSVATQEGTPLTMEFKPDGTKVYVIGAVKKIVYQYSLSTAWDISTASYDGKSYDISGVVSAPSGLVFSPDGTFFFVICYSTDKVHRFNLSTAWDVSTGSDPSIDFSVATQSSLPTGLFFKSDGKKFYIIDRSTDYIYQYSMNTDWNISTASYDDKRLYVRNQDGDPWGVVFNDDGTRIFIVGDANDRVYQYNLTTAWDVSTGSYSNKYLGSTGENTLRAVKFKPDDGSKMYLIGTTQDRIFQFTTYSDVSDSCTYSGSGNWAINLSDYCVISTNTNLSTNNISFVGTGNVTFNATITACNIGVLPASQRGFLTSNAKVNIGKCT